MNADPAGHLSTLVERLSAAGGDVADGSLWRELEDLQAALVEELFGRRPMAGDDRRAVADDPRLATLVDVLQALTLLTPGDPSYPWDLGLYLAVVGRHREAAAAQLDAAARFDAEAAAGDGLTGDEADWAQSARYQAAKSFVLGGLPASAAALLPRLSLEDRPEIEALLAAAGRG